MVISSFSIILNFLRIASINSFALKTPSGAYTSGSIFFNLDNNIAPITVGYAVRNAAEVRDVQYVNFMSLPSFLPIISTYIAALENASYPLLSGPLQ